MLRPKNCKKCGGKMQTGGLSPKYPNYNWMTTSTIPFMPQMNNEETYPDEVNIQIPSGETNYFNTPNGQGYNAMDASYNQAQQAEQFTSTNPMLPKSPDSSKPNRDPFFSLSGLSSGMAWLSGIAARKRQENYYRTQMAQFNQMNAMPYQDYQPNPINPGSDYAKYGGRMQAGGKAPIVVDNPNDPRLRAYNDSLKLYNNYQDVTKALLSQGYVNYKNKTSSNNFDSRIEVVNNFPKISGLRKESETLNSVDDFNIYTINKNLPRQLYSNTIKPSGVISYENNLKKGPGIYEKDGDSLELFDPSWYQKKKVYDARTVAKYDNVNPRQEVIYKPSSPSKPIYKKIVSQKPQIPSIPPEPLIKRPEHMNTNLPNMDIGQPIPKAPNLQVAKFDSTKPTPYSYTNATGSYLEAQTNYFPDEQSLRNFAADQNTLSIQASKKGATATGYIKKYQRGGTPIIVTNPNDPRLRAYNDSLNDYNAGEKLHQLINKYKSSIGITNKSRILAEKEAYKNIPTSYNIKNKPISADAPIPLWGDGIADGSSVQVNRYKKPVQAVVYQKPQAKEVTDPSGKKWSVPDNYKPKESGNTYADSLKLYNNNLDVKKYPTYNGVGNTELAEKLVQEKNIGWEGSPIYSKIQPIKRIPWGEGLTADIYKKPVGTPKPSVPQEPKFKRPVPMDGYEAPNLSTGQPSVQAPNLQRAQFDNTKKTPFSYTNATGNYLEGQTQYFPDYNMLKAFSEQQKNSSMQGNEKGATATGYIKQYQYGGFPMFAGAPRKMKNVTINNYSPFQQFDDPMNALSGMVGMPPSEDGASFNAIVQAMQNGMYKGGGWIQKAVNPDHKGFCSPMTKATCTPRRKAFAKTMKKHHGFHK